MRRCSVCRRLGVMRTLVRRKPLRNVATFLGLRSAPPQATRVRLRCSRSFIRARWWGLGDEALFGVSKIGSNADIGSAETVA